MINFCDGDAGDVCAKVYVHEGGYPDGEHGVPARLRRFFTAVVNQVPHDTRFDCPEYLAAKYVVWQAGINASYRATKNPLDFLSLGVCVNDMDDVEYIYDVICDGRGITKWPTVKYRAVEIK